MGVLSLESRTIMLREIEVFPKPLDASKVQLYKPTTSRSRMSVSSIFPGGVWSNNDIGTTKINNVVSMTTDAPSPHLLAHHHTHL